VSWTTAYINATHVSNHRPKPAGVPNTRCECQDAADHPSVTVPPTPNDTHRPCFRGPDAYRRHFGERYIVVVPMCQPRPKSKQKEVHARVPVSPHPMCVPNTRCACQTPSTTPPVFQYNPTTHTVHVSVDLTLIGDTLGNGI